jgi:hypothetical protein
MTPARVGPAGADRRGQFRVADVTRVSVPPAGRPSEIFAAKRHGTSTLHAGPR